MNENQQTINCITSDLERVFWTEFYHDLGSTELSEYSESGHPRFIGWTYGGQRRFEKEWNEEGFSLYFIDESGTGLIDWLWKNNSKLTNDYLNSYPKRKVYLVTETGKPSMIEFKLIHIPMLDLLAMNDEKKSSYGEDIFDLEYEYHMIFEDAIDQFDYEQSGAKMRSSEETREYLSDKKVLIPLFDDIREHLRSRLDYLDFDEEYTYWCGRIRDCDYGEDNYFNNFKRFCRKHDLDWLATKEALEKMTEQHFFCECEMVDLFEGRLENNVEEHWKQSETQEPASS